MHERLTNALHGNCLLDRDFGGEGVTQHLSDAHDAEATALLAAHSMQDVGVVKEIEAQRDHEEMMVSAMTTVADELADALIMATMGRMKAPYIEQALSAHRAIKEAKR